MTDVFDRMDKVTYVPVIGGPFISYTNDERFIINGKRITPLPKDSIFPHRSYLINPYHSFSDFPMLVEQNKLNDDRIVFSDSGGLQEINLGNKRYDHIEVFRWQEKYSNIGFCYDVIPFKSDDGARFLGWVFDGKNFLDCAQKTLQNIKDVNKIRTEFNNFKFYGIIQGRKYEEYKQWYDIIKEGQLDGYCVKTPNNNPLCLAETCCFVLNNINTPVHFLGVGNITKSAIVIYFSNFYKNKISFDSSSYDMGTRFRTYLVPTSVNAKIQINVENPIDTLNFCNCPVCQEFSKHCDVKKLILEDSPVLGPVISLHNLNYVTKLVDYLKTCGKDRQKFFDILNGMSSEDSIEKLNLAFNMIDDMVSKGIVYVQSKYKKLLEDSYNIDISKQGSLF